MSDIDEIKSRVNIVDVIGERVTLKKAGRNFKALCPFHGEKTPSFVVSPDRQTFHCFGCGKGGSVFDFIMLLDHLDFPEALEVLADRAGVTLEHRQTDTPEGRQKQRLLEANHLASEYYHYLLTKHAVGENARVYLEKRGVSGKSVETFMLGYSPNTWDGLTTYLRKKGYDERTLESGGLIIRGRNGYYDRFRGRVMFTLCDHRGSPVGFSGRVLDPDVKEAKYINTSETPIYTKGKVLYGLNVTKDAIQKSNEAVLMEGELDVISSFQAGISNAVAIKGSAVTEDHARLLRRFTERLVFALDADMAGDAAARRGIEIAEKSGFDMRVATMPSGKDPDEAARENPGLLKKAIKDAVPMYDYFLSSAFSRFDATTAYGKRKVSDEFLPVLSKIDNPVVQGHYARALATRLGVSEEVIAEGLSKLRSRVHRSARDVKPERENDRQELTRVEKAEMYAAAFILQGDTPRLLSSFLRRIPVEEITYMPLRRITESLLAYLPAHVPYQPKDFAEALPKELVTVFDEAFLTDVSEILDDGERLDREWEKVVREVRRLHLKKKMEDVGKELYADDPSTGQYDGKQALLKQYTDELVALEKSP